MYYFDMYFQIFGGKIIVKMENDATQKEVSFRIPYNDIIELEVSYIFNRGFASKVRF